MDAIFVSHNDTTELIVNFFADSTARGAVMNCVSISTSGVVNFTSSVLLTLERINDTATTAIDLYPGEYSVYFYDIEQDGKLSLGEGYSAVTDQVLASGNKLGFNTQNSHPFQEYFTCNIIIMGHYMHAAMYSLYNFYQLLTFHSLYSIQILTVQ